MLLLLLLSLAFSLGTAVVFFATHLVKTQRLNAQREGSFSPGLHYTLSPTSDYLNRPSCWLAIKSQNLLAVQTALEINNPTPCAWSEGLEKRLFIAPPVKGWILVMGTGLPDPIEDVDRCYRFVRRLSRKLGQVQLFSCNRVLNHHGWVRADAGRVKRAFAWAGQTIWKEGTRTSAETELDMRCPGYGETFQRSSYSPVDALGTNLEKLPILAARWSLDPALISEQMLDKGPGIAGEPSTRF